ncbi:MAG: alanyl-tRNA editing protein [Oscillospiraceae bacterium]|nr:alanyl-tRNA editing protein [Oscillospiraceae bacterium]
MTEKLYYTDSFIKKFTAKVLSCRETKAGFEVILDRTAFFPEGGGQSADTGKIGGAQVADAHERNGEVIHYVNQALSEGEEYECEIDWLQRFRRMQNHSGEHIVSGLVNTKYGFNNVGFHMGRDAVTIDFDGDLSHSQLVEIEREANLAVAADIGIKTGFPSEEKLKTLEYRSKLELTENVRIVEIEGVDICACCAPHLRSTAQVGIVKILSAERRRRGGEGVRVTMLCGLDAVDYLGRIHESNAGISAMLSVPREETDKGVERMLKENERLRQRVSELGRELARLRAEGIAPVDGNICIFDDVLEEPALRDIVNVAAEKCGGVAAVFSGSDETGYRYIIGSKNVNLRANSGLINTVLGGRGGGRPEMIQGSCTASAEKIKDFLSTFLV